MPVGTFSSKFLIRPWESIPCKTRADARSFARIIDLSGTVGFLESYCQAIHNGLKTALAGCDLDMLAGSQMNSGTLFPTIQSGELPISLIDDKVRRMLREIISVQG